MTSTKHQHCYANYVNHILNTSPTKVTYTFPKSQRFEPLKKQMIGPVDEVIQILKDDPQQIAFLQYRRHLMKENQASYYKDHKMYFDFTRNQMRPTKILQKMLRNSRSKQKISNIKDKSSKKKSKSKQKRVSFQNINNFKDRQKSFSKLQKQGKSPAKLNNTYSKQPSTYKKSYQNIKQGRLSSKSRSKQKRGLKQSPIKSFQPDCYFSPQKVRTYAKLQHEYTKASVRLLSFLQRNKQTPLQKHLSKNKLNRSKSFEERSGKKPLNSPKRQVNSPVKRQLTQTNLLKELNYPAKNVTSDGYYPTGLQLKSDGKYPVSTFKNVPTTKFASPTKNKNRSPDRFHEIGGIFYNPDLHKTDKTYNPFSQFGNPKN